jgi:hypothetical protein
MMRHIEVFKEGLQAISALLDVAATISVAQPMRRELSCRTKLLAKIATSLWLTMHSCVSDTDNPPTQALKRVWR